MAKGKACKQCNYPMLAQKEDYQPKGTWVTYVCQNGECSTVKRGFPQKDKVFEESR